MRVSWCATLGWPTLLPLLMAFGANGCGDSGTNLGGDDDQDGSSDSAVPADDGGSADEGTGSDDGGSAEDFGGGDDGAGSCECLNPLDSCERDVCVRTAYTCNALHACETGYECTPDSRCRCTDPNICGIRCDRTGFCPGDSFPPLACAPDGICRPPLPCIEDSMCPAGELCIGQADVYPTCAAPGSVAVGGSCTANTNCMEGVCETDVCLHRCRLNSDCDPGLLCGDTRNQQLGCMVATSCTGCTAAGQYCSGGSNCHTSNCTTNAECPENCYHELMGPANAGECMTDPFGLACSDDEFASMMSPETCLVFRGCWDDDDCESPYECVLGPFPTDVGFCGRTP